MQIFSEILKQSETILTRCFTSQTDRNDLKITRAISVSSCFYLNCRRSFYFQRFSVTIMFTLSYLWEKRKSHSDSVQSCFWYHVLFMNEMVPVWIKSWNDIKVLSQSKIQAIVMLFSCLYLKSSIKARWYDTLRGIHIESSACKGENQHRHKVEFNDKEWRH